MSNDTDNGPRQHRNRAERPRPQHGQIEGLSANTRKTLIKEFGLGEEIIDLLGCLLVVWLCDILSVVCDTGSIVSATRLKALGEGELQPGINAEGGVLL